MCVTAWTHIWWLCVWTEKWSEELKGCKKKFDQCANKYIRKKREWPSCLHNQPWCHYEPFLNSLIKKLFFHSIFSLFPLPPSFSTSPFRSYQDTSLFPELQNRTLFPSLVFITRPLSCASAHSTSFLSLPSCSNWITAREAPCQKYQDVLIKPGLCWSSSTKARWGGGGTKPLKEKGGGGLKERKKKGERELFKGWGVGVFNMWKWFCNYGKSASARGKVVFSMPPPPQIKLPLV